MLGSKNMLGKAIKHLLSKINLGKAIKINGCGL